MGASSATIRTRCVYGCASGGPSGCASEAGFDAWLVGELHQAILSQDLGSAWGSAPRVSLSRVDPAGAAWVCSECPSMGSRLGIAAHDSRRGLGCWSCARCDRLCHGHRSAALSRRCVTRRRAWSRVSSPSRPRLRAWPGFGLGRGALRMAPKVRPTLAFVSGANTS